MFDHDPTRPEFQVPLDQHDKIVCFFTLDMPAKLGNDLSYTFTPDQYLGFEYEKAEVSLVDDQTYIVKLVYTPRNSDLDPQVEGYTYLFTYYSIERKLLLQEVVDLDILQKLDAESEQYANQKVQIYQKMLESLRRLAKNDTHMAATLEKYDSIKHIIATNRNAVRNGFMDKSQANERTVELEQMHMENEMMMLFLIDAVANRDEDFAQQVNDYEIIAEAQNKIDEQIARLEADATPEPVDARYFIDTLEMLASLEKDPEA